MSSSSQTMTAIEITGKGGPEVLVAREMPMPAPGPGQLLVRNVACGVNRPDVQQRKGLYPAPKGHSPIPGLEVAGHVEVAGPGTRRFKAGDAVMALSTAAAMRPIPSPKKAPACRCQSLST